MALINCPECNKEISDSAKMCPHCGYELFDYKLRNAKKPPQYTPQPKKKKNGCLIAVAVIVSISILSAIFGDDDSSNKDAAVSDLEQVDNVETGSNSEIKSIPELTDKQKTIKLDSLIMIYRELYNELQKFKTTSNFKTYGFAKGGHYHTWLHRAETLSKDDYVDLLLPQNLFVGDLLRLGLAYAGSEGAETDITKDVNKIIIAGLKRRSKNTSLKAESPSNKTRIGKWKITNLYTELINHTIEIYKESGKCYAIKDYGNEQKKESLSLKGTKYYIVGNRYGEWYRIKGDALIMGDKEGVIEDGTIATSY